VLIRHSKTDQEGQGQEVAIPRGYRLRPVEAVQTWLAAAEINDGPVFRPVLKGGRLQSVALKDHAGAAGHALKSSIMTMNTSTMPTTISTSRCVMSDAPR
jgi:hypothetical protein